MITSDMFDHGILLEGINLDEEIITICDQTVEQAMIDHGFNIAERIIVGELIAARTEAAQRLQAAFDVAAALGYKVVSVNG